VRNDVLFPAIGFSWKHRLPGGHQKSQAGQQSSNQAGFAPSWRAAGHSARREAWEAFVTARGAQDPPFGFRTTAVESLGLHSLG
jgi:hypothetical protein